MVETKAERNCSFSTCGENSNDTDTIISGQPHAERLVKEEDQEVSTKYKWYNVNTEFLPAKICYFTDSAKKLTYLPNLILFLTSLGLSKSEAGVILGFSTLGTILGGPFWGMLADKWKSHRLIIFIIAFASCFTMCCQPFVALHVANQPTANSCKSVVAKTTNSTVFHHNHTDQFSKVNNVTVSILDQNLTNLLKTPSKTLTNGNNDETTNNHDSRYGKLFFVFLFLAFATSFTDNSIAAFIDTGTVRKIQLSKGRKVIYGRQRTLSPAGAIIGNISSNLFIQYFPQASISCFTGMFLCYAVFSIATLVSLIYLYGDLNFNEDLKNNSKDDNESENEHIFKHAEKDDDNAVTEDVFEKIGLNNVTNSRSSFRRTLIRTISRVDIIFLYLTALVFGISASSMLSFHYLLLKDLNADSIYYSLITMAGAVGGTLGFFYTNKVIRALKTWKTLILCSVLQVGCLLTYGLSNAPWILIAVRPFFGFAFCTILTTCLSYLKDHCPVDVITTTVSICLILFYGVGPGIGLTIGGRIYENYNGKTLFCSMSVLVSFWTLVIFGYIMMSSKRSGELKVEDDEKVMFKKNNA
ncbi:major facilitator superfamily domain-containing protein 6-like [Clytia hemisphaerica]|uniref:Major facilitator superfamily associated domain-containing protein n=1 Tax=Clytia hemisphaerica TaxID=252671 RepID=A0A7M5U5X8_9CNID